jgi:predicted Fe-Mo cluster-binding NifX family protein
MTRIAVATEDAQVAQHFGHCPSYRVYDVADGTVQTVQEVANPGHDAGFPPDFVAALGANVVIVGGIGAGAINRFQDHGIEVIAGADGLADAAVREYLAGRLEDAGSGCAGHDHGDHDCGH